MWQVEIEAAAESQRGAGYCEPPSNQEQTVGDPLKLVRIVRLLLPTDVDVCSLPPLGH
jgi:hypothetical protein